ncbi:HalOD1 output domain-containing protein [Halogeometricum salsisoli]|uniref:HalOD1 output domain-containing protein n=1 Tax=Halogeometricum salsisoli TaxID=2950536 RepID=UPI00287BA80D|nr:HalOD1 output domain-containing protein [Halogeometricum sp. S1BR25-6]
MTPQDPLSIRLVTEISRLEGVEPFELPPLEDCVDTESLDSLFGRPDAPFHEGEVKFRYAGYDVTVKYTGEFDIA